MNRNRIWRTEVHDSIVELEGGRQDGIDRLRHLLECMDHSDEDDCYLCCKELSERKLR